MSEKKSKKKQRFLILCYLLLIIGIVLFFTWAKYEKTITGEVIFPDTTGFQASILLGESVDVSAQLSELLPGYSSGQSGKYIDFEVYNYNQSTQETLEAVTETNIAYYIVVNTGGNIPLELFLEPLDENGNSMTDSDGNTIRYQGVRETSSTTYSASGYSYTFYSNLETYKEAEFYFGDTEKESQSFCLYFGWGTQETVITTTEVDDTTITTETIVYYNDEQYMGEIELMEIRAVVTSDAPEANTITEEPIVIDPATETDE